jgi:dTDP-4-amino-4,6-dideoxygalactose transaminase
MTPRMYKVPFVDFSRIPSEVLESQKTAASNVIDAGLFVGGPPVASFENEWAEAIGVDFAVGVGNGLDGLVIALKALGIGKGDLVAVPAHTFIATWNAVVLAGATPVGIDVDQYGLLDLALLESDKRKFAAVIPVHMHGMMVDMVRLRSWAQSRLVRVVEDASQAHLAQFQGGFAGSFSDIGVFSLYPSKNLGALGDAGINVTNSLKLDEKMRSYRNYGASNADKYLHTSFGVNSRLDTMQAALLSVNLRYLPDWNKCRTQLAETYLQNLSPNDFFSILNNGDLDSVWHHFPIITGCRDQMQKYLQDKGIQTEIHYPNLAAKEYAQISGKTQERTPRAEKLAEQILSLPISPWHTEEQILYVCEILNNFNESSH